MLKARQLELSLTYTEKILQNYATSPPEIPKLGGEESSTIQKLVADTDKETSVKSETGEEKEGVTTPDYKIMLEQCASTKEDANK